MKHKPKTKRFPCWKCNERFSSYQQRDAHIASAHPLPRKTVYEVKRFGEVHSLIGGKDIKLGDQIAFTKTGVVTKIIHTENSNDVQIEIAVIEDYFVRS
jgi:hypothetical protein